MGFLSGLFSGSNLTKSLLTGGVSTAHEINKRSPGYKKLFPDAPIAPTAPDAPTIDAADAAAEDKANQLRRRRGMAATILGGLDNAQPTTQTSSLLGS